MYKVIVFTLNEQNYALDLENISSILEYTDITPIPNSPDLISGVIKVRGNIYSVINGSKLLGGTIHTDDSRIILLDDERKIALHVQETKNVITVSEDNIRLVSELVNQEKRQLIKNVIEYEGIILEISLQEILNLFE